MAFITKIGLACCMALMLCWPAVFNGQAFFFPDTSTYIKGAAMGVQKALKYRSPWLDGGSATTAPSAQSAQAGPQEPSPGSVPSSAGQSVPKNVLKGRSIYYGAFVLLTSEFLGTWATVALQALLASLCVMLVIARLGVRLSVQQYLLLGVALAAFSTLPFSASMLMPDFLAGVCLLLAAALLVAPGWRASQAFAAVAVLSFGALSHSTILILLAMLVAATWLLRPGIRKLAGGPVVQVRGTLLIALAIVIGLAGEWAFGLMVKRGTGHEPIRPPFVMARLIADGPGAHWLNMNCESSSLLICEFRQQAIQGSADSILWSPDPKRGVFSATDPETQRKLAGEETRFVWAVVHADPWGVAGSVIRNASLQAVRFGLNEYNYGADIERYRDRLPPRLLADLEASRAARNAVPARAIEWVQSSAVAASLAVIVMLLLRSRVGGHARDSRLADFRGFLVLLLLGVALNALLCGALSMPVDRYAARIIWVLVLSAVLSAMLWVRSREGQA